MPKGVYVRKAELTHDEDGPLPVAPSSLNQQLETVAVEVAAAKAEAAAELAAMKADLAAELERVKGLSAKLEMQTTVKAEVSEALRLQQEEAKRQAFGKPTPSEAPVMPAKPDEELTTIKLDRHYRPMGYYEIVGWHKEAVFRKRPDGQVVEVEKAEFIPGEKKPPLIAGVGFATKIWAGTVLRLPKSEAREVRNAKIGSVEID